MVTRPPVGLLPNNTPKPCGSMPVPSSVGWIDRLSGSEKMLLEKVMLSCTPQTLAVSSTAQLKEQ